MTTMLLCSVLLYNFTIYSTFNLGLDHSTFEVRCILPCIASSLFSLKPSNLIQVWKKFAIFLLLSGSEGKVGKDGWNKCAHKEWQPLNLWNSEQKINLVGMALWTYVRRHRVTLKRKAISGQCRASCTLFVSLMLSHFDVKRMLN